MMNKLLFCLSVFIIASCSSTKKITNANPVFANNMVVAHRGAWKKNNLPENSIASLKKAIELKCTGSEFDVRMTADDSLVINHDPNYHKLFIEKTTYAELSAYKLSNGEKLPTLREYLKAGLQNNTSTRFFCEIKPSDLGKKRGQLIAEKVMSLVNELNAQHMVVYISFDYNILKKLVEINPKVSTQFLGGTKAPEVVKADGISGLDYSLVAWKKHPGWIDSAKQNNLTLNAWNATDTTDIDWLLANKFDFISTDEPELVLERMKVSPVSNGWKLIWSDEFHVAGLPDTSKWAFGTGGGGFGNNEKQFYMENSLENSFIADGILHLVAHKKDHENSRYTSAKLITYQKFGFQYGKVEVRAKLPKGKGTWPAIWMLPESLREKKEKWPSSGEIDIMEHVGKDPNVVHTSLHTGLYNHIKKTQISHSDIVENADETFHKYGMEWTENDITFLIDDKVFFQSSKGQDGRITTNEGWPFDKIYYLILNLAIGGNWGGPIDDSIFPAEMQIDFVRVFQKK
jgi:beta-glucanase (GH16 family)/glycerophosphoryl diester phosphodiesterase